MKRYNEMLTEISKKTIGSYTKAAKKDLDDKSSDRTWQRNMGDDKAAETTNREINNRVTGIDRAEKKMNESSKSYTVSFHDPVSKKEVTSVSAAHGGKINSSSDAVNWARKHVSKTHNVDGMEHKVTVHEATEYPVMNARSPADKEFANAHPVDATDDVNGNGDEVFKGTTSKDTSRKADKWTGDDDADDAESEEGLDTAGTFHTEDFDTISEGVGLNYHLERSSLHNDYRVHHTKKATEARAAGNHELASKHDHAADVAGDASQAHYDASKHYRSFGNAGSKDGRKEASDHAIKLGRASTKAHEQLKRSMQKEDIDESFQLQELSKKVLGSYIKKAANNGMIDAQASGGDYSKSAEEMLRRKKHLDKAVKRLKGIRSATDKLVKEGEELQELSKKTLGNYVKKAARSMSQLDRKYDKLDAHDSNINSAGMNASDEVRDHLRSARDSMRADMRKLNNKSSNRADGIHRAIKRLTKEDLDQMDDDEFVAVCESFDQLDELSKETLKSYIKKATASNAAKKRVLDKQDRIMRPNEHGWDAKRQQASEIIGQHVKSFHKRRKAIELAKSKLVKEDMREASGTSFSVDNSDGGKKVHVTTGDTKHTVHRQRTMSSSHYVVHDHKSGNKKTFPYASDVADHLNDSGHEGVHSKHLSALY